MKLRFFWIPAHGDAAAEAELDDVLARNRVAQCERQFCAGGTAPGWAICLEIAAPAAPVSAPVSGPGGDERRVDYRQALDAPTFAVFAALRTWRKGVADREGNPVYAVLSNEQLAEIATRRCASLAELEAIKGIGPARVRKYGEGVLAVLRAMPPAVPTADEAEIEK